MSDINNAIKLYKEPGSKDYDLIASWPGIGNVSLILARYLKDKLNAEEIGIIEPFDFYNPIGVMVRNNAETALLSSYVWIDVLPQLSEVSFAYHL